MLKFPDERGQGARGQMGSSLPGVSTEEVVNLFERHCTMSAHAVAALLLMAALLLAPRFDRESGRLNTTKQAHGSTRAHRTIGVGLALVLLNLPCFSASCEGWCAGSDE